MKQFASILYDIVVVGVLGLICIQPAYATNAEFEDALRGLGSKDRDTILQSIQRLGELNEGSALPALEALENKKLLADGDGNLYILGDDEQLRDPLSGEVANVDPNSLEKPSVNNRVRKELKPVIAKLKLVSPDSAVRLAAAQELSKSPSGDAAKQIRAALQKETVASVRVELEVALALIELQSDNPVQRVAAVQAIGSSGNQSLVQLLAPLLEKDEAGEFIEQHEEVRTAAQMALRP